MASKAKSNPLVGQFFHSFESEEDRKEFSCTWQGYVKGEVAPGYFLVQTFDWLGGDEYTMHIVPIEKMLLWQFYDSAEWMREVHKQRGHFMRRKMEREIDEREGVPYPPR